MSILYEATASATGSKTVLGVIETVSATASATGVTPEIAIETAKEEALKAVKKLLESDSPPTPTPTPTNKQINIVQEYLDTNNAASKSPFSACTFGNAFNGNEIFIGSGNAGPNDEKVDSTMYWRWASLTKLLGQLTLGAALEDGIIQSVDEEVWNYIPEVANITTYVSDSEAVIDEFGNAVYDEFGTPKYSQILSTDPNLGKKITIRMLMNCSSGLGYSIWGIGSLREIFVNNFANTKSGQNYIAWLQNIENNNAYADTMTSSYNNMPNITFTKSILERTLYPLLCIPGTTNIYDSGMTFLGAVIGAALQKKGIQQTPAEYTQSRILIPLGMSNTWLNYGSLNPPTDVLSKLTNAFFVRQNIPNSILGSYQKGENVLYDVLYSVFDKTINGDGFKMQNLDIYTKEKTSNYFSNDNYAGGFDWSGCGTMSDYCKLLKLLINKGYNPENKKQILSKQTVEWLLSSKYSTTRLSYGLNAPNDGLINLLHPSTTWCGGYSKFMENTENLPYACGPNTFTFSGYFGIDYYFDTETGNYLFSGTQNPGASWQLSTSTKPFKPDGAFIWKTLTSI